MAAMHLLAALATLTAFPAVRPQASVPAAAAQAARPQPAPPATAQPAAPGGRTGNPYDGIFGPPGKPRLRVELDGGGVRGYGSRQPLGEPTIICGTVILRPDPLIDAKMRLPKLEPGVTYTIRTLLPPICRG